jgi:hypothetical protein
MNVAVPPRRFDEEHAIIKIQDLSKTVLPCSATLK